MNKSFSGVLSKLSTFTFFAYLDPIFNHCLFIHSINSVPSLSSVAQSCPTLCNPMNCSMPGLPVHHQLPEFTQTHVQLVHPKGNQSWIFGRTDAKAEAPILWPLDVDSWLTGKDPNAGKDRGQEEKGLTEDKTVGWYHWLNAHEFEQARRQRRTGKPGVLQSLGSQRVRHDLATEQQCSMLNFLSG